MKYYLIIALLALTGAAATGQSRFRTDESIISQLKNGTAPGLVFSTEPAAKKEITPRPVSTQKSIGRQIRSNTVPGLQYKEEAGGTNAEKVMDTRREPTPSLDGVKAADGQKPAEKPTTGQNAP
ncbi:hypothetical protein GCM10023091_23490 [Ravibacter arvi]|uniref:DUF4148 domain-containing protein n=1 Tax=Ravibacter arvi TaxID=2051041 RepID=A0ABP8LY86_9BACT